MGIMSAELGRGPGDNYVKTHAEKQKSSWNCGERQLTIRDCESAGARHNIYHRLPVMTAKLNLVENR